MKIKTILFVSLMLCIMGVQSVFAQVISTSVDAETAVVGDEIVFSVKADAQKVSGMQFNITYDEDVFAYVDSVSSEFFDNALASGINSDNPGSIGVLMGFVEEQEINGEILSVTFKVKGSNGEHAIKVNDIKLVVNKEKILEDEIVVEFEIDSEEQSSGSGSKGNSSSRPSGSNKNQDKKVVTPEQNTKTDLTPEDTDIKEENTSVESELTDISGHWAEANIRYLVSMGIVNGFEDNTFAPDKNVTRAEFATMISKALALSEASDNIYSDVSGDAWYKDTVLKCTKAGLIKGDSGKFRPDDLISREEMTVIVYRAKAYLELANEETVDTKSNFTDDNEISDWAKQAVVAMSNCGIINGIDGNIFAPKLSATRAQAVVVLEKLLKIQK